MIRHPSALRRVPALPTGLSILVTGKCGDRGGVSNVCLVVKSARRVAAVEPDRRVSIKASSVASGVFTAAAVCAFYLA